MSLPDPLSEAFARLSRPPETVTDVRRWLADYRDGHEELLGLLARCPALAVPLMSLRVAIVEHSHVDPRLRVLAGLEVARTLASEHLWNAHAARARDLGISQALVEALGRGNTDRPIVRPTDRMVVRFTRGFVVGQDLDESLVTALVRRLGVSGTMERALRNEVKEVWTSLLSHVATEAIAVGNSAPLTRAAAAARALSRQLPRDAYRFDRILTMSLVAGSSCLVHGLILNGLRPSWELVGLTGIAMPDVYSELADSIEARDATRARASLQALVRRGPEDQPR